MASKVEDFSAGDQVSHILNGPGLCTKVEDGTVYVRFDKPFLGDMLWVGEYDKEWFDAFPESLKVVAPA